MQRSTTVKLLLIGDPGVGKSSLSSRFVDDALTSISTKKMDFKHKKMEVNGETIDLQIWDNPSTDSYSNKPFYFDGHGSGAAGVILVYDITNRESFKNIETWMMNARQRQRDDCKFILVGTKSDLSHEQDVDSKVAATFAKKHGMQFFEISAKKNKNRNVDKLDDRDVDKFNVGKFFEAFVQEIRKPFAVSVPPAPSEVKKEKEVKKAIEIDVSNVAVLKELVLSIAKGEKNAELKQLGQMKNLKEAVLIYLQQQFATKEVYDIFSSNKNSRALNDFFKVQRGVTSLSLFGGTKKEFEALEKSWLLSEYQRKKLGEGDQSKIKYAPQQPSAPSSMYDSSGGGAELPSAPSAPSSMYDSSGRGAVLSSAPSAPYAPSDPSPSAPAAASGRSSVDAKARSSSVPQSTEGFNDRTKTYLNGLRDKLTVAERIAELELTKEEEAAFEKFMDPITFDYIRVPVTLHEVSFDLNTLLKYLQKGKNNHPTTTEKFTKQEIEPNRNLLNALDEAISKLKKDRAKKHSAPRP
jgi:small GTP-binding protein